MGLFASLFQPNKGHLSPAGRAFISWLEIVIIGIIVALASVGLEYLNGHPGDYSGLWNVLIATLVISILKAFAGLSIPRVTPQAPLPLAQQAPALVAQAQQQPVQQQVQAVPQQPSQPTQQNPQLQFADSLWKQQTAIMDQPSGTYPYTTVQPPQ